MYIESRRRIADACVCLLLILSPGGNASAQEPAPHKRVLLLFDEDKTLPGLAILDRSIRETIVGGFGSDIEFFTESLNVSQFSDERHLELLREYYARKYGDRKLDLVVSVMGPALSFLLRHGDAAFPGVQIVFCGADAADIEGVRLPSRVTGLLVQRVFGPTLEIMLRLQPEMRHVTVVGGTSQFDRHLMKQARSEFKTFEPRVSFEYLTELPVHELLGAVSRRPQGSAIAFVTLFRDGTGRAYVPHDVVSRISEAANVPVYIFVDQYLGRGTVGGHLYSLEQVGKSAGEAGVRVLRGESSSNIPVRKPTSTANIFDARQLAHWGLDERRLPPGSTVLFREPDFWDRYRAYILIGMALLLAQTALIAGLLVQRSRRQRAEAELRGSYERIRNLGRRLLTAQDAERAHLARELHDDVGQQIGLLQLELQTLLRSREHASVGTGLADSSTRATAIGRSLHDLSHRLHPTHLRLVGLTASLGSLQREYATANVKIAFSHENVPDSVTPETTMCLYRVAQEALSNAIKHGRASSVSVHLSGADDGLSMTIEDDGVGFDVGAAADGLGLISMSERVEQMQGTFHVRSRPGEGTRLRVTVPSVGTVRTVLH